MKEEEEEKLGRKKQSIRIRMQENVRLSETIPLHYDVFHVPVDDLLRFTFCTSKQTHE